MKTFLAPNGENITIPDGKVITFGLSKEQNKLVASALPVKGYELLDTDALTDLIAISCGGNHYQCSFFGFRQKRNDY